MTLNILVWGLAGAGGALGVASIAAGAHAGNWIVIIWCVTVMIHCGDRVRVTRRERRGQLLAERSDGRLQRLTERRERSLEAWGDALAERAMLLDEQERRMQG